jgi:hypothetical protein
MIQCHPRRKDSLIGGLLEMISKNQFVSSQGFLNYKPSKANSTYYIYLHSLCTFSHENLCLEVMVQKVMAAEIGCLCSYSCHIFPCLMRFQIAAFVAILRYCTKDIYYFIVLNTVRQGT